MSTPLPGRSTYLWIAGVIVALDQVTKALVDHLMMLHESRTIVEGLVRLTYVQNRGAAFGILSEAGLPYQSVLFSVVSLLALALHHSGRLQPRDTGLFPRICQPHSASDCVDTPLGHLA